MSLSTFSEYMGHLRSPQHRLWIAKNSVSVVAQRFYSTWTVTPRAGVTPTTAAALGKADSSVSADWPNAASGDTRLLAVRSHSIRTAGARLLCDRLSHQGGLSGTTAGEQTTNLPTAALTRYTSGEGVLIGAEIYTTVGTTGTTITANYTNQAGTSGRTTQAVRFGAVNWNVASRFIFLPLQAGDTGCRSVEGVSLAASTVSAAGNFGITLYKPLVMIPGRDTGGSVLLDALSAMVGVMPVVDGACLWWLTSSPSTVSQADDHEMMLAEIT